MDLVHILDMVHSLVDLHRLLVGHHFLLRLQVLSQAVFLALHHSDMRKCVVHIFHMVQEANFLHSSGIHMETHHMLHSIRMDFFYTSDRLLVLCDFLGSIHHH